MKVIRFSDDDGLIHYGHPQEDSEAILLDGFWQDGFEETDRVVHIQKLLAPIDPVAILCIGLNYRQHAEETGAAIPEHPCLFMKNPAALNHPGDPIALPPNCMNPAEVDYEIELAVIIGRDARDVSADNALSYVAGYTIANDVSARVWQKQRSSGQWVRGKSFDTFCPMGPAMVTTDSIPDPQQLTLSCRLNGEEMQRANTSDMIFPVATLIERLSAGMTLLSGSVILTGTPSGVGVARSPQVFLKGGDKLDLTIEPIGTLTSPVVELTGVD